MVVREKYLEKIRGFYDSDLIKVIVGIRRSGKSVILQSIIKEIQEITDNIIYINFEDYNWRLQIKTAKNLIDFVEQKRKTDKCYCFFDEIQELPNWQLAVKHLRIHNCSVFITGSNSKLLASEFLAELSGRFVSFQVRPFVYKEICQFAKENNVDIDINNYLIWGGFPGRLKNLSKPDTIAYLTDLKNTIVINDIITRYKIKNEIEFISVANFIFKNNSRIFSARSIYKYMKHDFPHLALSTITRFVEVLKSAYAIETIKQYSTKTKADLVFLVKTYNADAALNSINVENNIYDFDHNLENIVFNELLYRDYSLKVFINGDKEIDFLATKYGKTYYIQVAYSVIDKKAHEREFSAFSKIDNQHEKILITNDDFDFSTSTVKHIKLKDFLISEDLV